MANWHYINKDGEKITVTSKELKQLALQGTITPETIVETEEGKTAPARKVKGLTFAGTTQPESMPSAETYSLANDSLAEKNVQKSTVNYFYTDENGIKSGQINKQRLQTLIDRGTFTSSTQLETDTGQKVTAEPVLGLKFKEGLIPAPEGDVESLESTVKQNNGLLQLIRKYPYLSLVCIPFVFTLLLMSAINDPDAQGGLFGGFFYGHWAFCL